MKRYYLLPLYFIYFLSLGIVFYLLGVKSIDKQAVYNRGVKDGKKAQLVEDIHIYEECKGKVFR